MSEDNGLPKGWTWAMLGDITSESTNGFGKRRSEGGAQSIVLRLADIQDRSISLESIRRIGTTNDEVEKYSLACNDLLVIRVNGSPDLVGRMVRFTTSAEPVLFCDHFIRLRLADPDFASFVRYYADTGAVRHFVEQNKVSSAGQNTISQGTMDRLSIPLAPRNEQVRIVTKIDELFSDLDAGVAALKRAKANLKRYRAAVLKAAVEGKLTEAWRAEHPNTDSSSKLLERILTERRQKWEADQIARFAAAKKEAPKNWKDKYVEPTPPHTAGLRELPEGWCWATLGQLLRGIEGGKSFKCQTRPASMEEWGVIKVSAMTWGTFLEEEQKAIPVGSQFDPSVEIKPSDLLLSRSNTTELVGATVLVGNCRPRLLLSDKSLRLRMSESLDRVWLHKALSSAVARRQLSAMATGTSDSMRNVSQEKIESVILPLPPSIEQGVIVAEVEERLSIVTSSEHLVDDALLRAARLRQSILKQAFEGKLVSQDPTDAPASELLERIKRAGVTASGQTVQSHNFFRVRQPT